MHFRSDGLVREACGVVACAQCRAIGFRRSWPWRRALLSFSVQPMAGQAPFRLGPAGQCRLTPHRVPRSAPNVARLGCAQQCPAVASRVPSLMPHGSHAINDSAQAATCSVRLSLVSQCPAHARTNGGAPACTDRPESHNAAPLLTCRPPCPIKRPVPSHRVNGPA